MVHKLCSLVGSCECTGEHAGSIKMHRIICPAGQLSHQSSVKGYYTRNYKIKSIMVSS
jgi:hypothetical protein